MESLLQSQIRESCKLALPEGLQELMSDISREVLRSQPENLYQFIADYLGALMQARDILSIACRICGDVTSCSCEPQLEDELSRIGLSNKDVLIAKNIIIEHFDKGQVQEPNLLMKLAKKTKVTEKQLGNLHKAIQKAFQRYLKPKDLQVSFGKLSNYSVEPTTDDSRSEVSGVSTQSCCISDFYKPSLSPDTVSAIQDSQAKYLHTSNLFSQLSVSATTLAGSYVHLPKRIPYSVHNSECNSNLIKSEKSVLNLLKTIIFTENRQREARVIEENVGTLDSFDSYETGTSASKEMDDTIRSVFSHGIHEARYKNSAASDDRSTFKANAENLSGSSSDGL